MPVSPSIIVPAETFQSDFGFYLISEPTIVQAVATDEKSLPAIYANRALQDTTADPYIVFTVNIAPEEQLVGGPPDVLDATVSIECGSSDYDVSKAVGDAVKNFLRFLQLPARLKRPDGIPGQYILLGHWVLGTRDEDQNEAGLFVTVVEVGMQVQFA